MPRDRIPLDIGFRGLLRGALRYRWTFVGIFLSSAAAAILWGANLGTIYPIVDVVLQRQSLHGWVDNRIAQGEARRAGLIRELAETPNGQPAGGGGDPSHLRRKRSHRELTGELAAEEQALAHARRLRPWIQGYLPSDPYSTLKLVVLVLLIGTLVKSAFLVVNMILVERIAQQVTCNLRNELYARTLEMDMRFFGRERSSQLLSLLTYDVESVLSAVRTIFGRAILEPLKILACLVGAAWICWRLLFLSLVITPLAILVIDRLARRVKRASHRAMDEMAGLYNRLTESLNGILVVKANNMERHEQRRFRQQGKTLLKRCMRIAAFQALSKPSNELLSMSVIGMALLAGGYLVLNEETHLMGFRMSSRPLGFGALMTFFAFLAGVSDPFRKLVDVYNQIQQGFAASERIERLQRQEPRISDIPEPSKIELPLQQITVSEVTFGYHPEQPVLRGVDLQIQAGETIAVVGPNGCGKSTLLALLLRLYDPCKGQVFWNGQDLRQLRQADLRKQIGLVTQQSVLFDETIADNIRYGCPTATESEVIEAARRAHAHDFIAGQLPQGYDTCAGAAGKLLSGGQRQRIALARAILRNPQLLLLDEATSQVDMESERLIQTSLAEFTEGRTTILVAHRPETIALANRIVVLDDGRVVDEGRHDELLTRCPFYARLYHCSLGVSISG
jgi:ATP-binding cassette subfamily B protein/subfamily B ATP-binding cassette protein MsbA